MNFKNIFILVISILLSIVSYGQELKIIHFSMPSGKWNGTTNTLTVNRNAASDYLTSIRIGKPPLPEWFDLAIEFQVEFTAVNSLGESIKLIDDVIFKNSDFADGKVSGSNYRYPELKIPANFINEYGGQLIIKYRYKKASYPIPDQVNGWTDWYTYTNNSDRKINLKLAIIQLPAPTITGDNAICSESTYTIANASTVTLENAIGIATLTNLGNGQYKVARVNNGNGVVTIKAINANGDVVNKSITVGVLKPLAINGHSNPLNWSNDYIYTVDTPNPNDILEIEKSGASQVTFTRLSNNSFRITTPTKPNNPGPVSKVYLVNINARVVSDCGNSEYISKEINVGTSVPFE